MGKRMGKWLLAAVLMIPLGQAWAGQNDQGQNNNDQGQNNQGPTTTNHRGVPEISPAALPAMGAMLVGFSLLVSHRRKSVGGA
jgi:hypothetical protein